MTKKGRGKILAVLLAAMLILSCTPAGMAFADVAAPAAPIINPNGGSISTSSTVGIDAETTVSQAVYYTIASGSEGTTPSVNSSVYSAPFIVSTSAGTFTVQAAVYDSGTGQWSSPASAVFLVVDYATGAPAAPTINPNGGSISRSRSIGIEAETTVNQAVYFTKDGSWPYRADGTPSDGASVYASPFYLTAGTHTVQAAVYDSGTRLWSSVATAIFNVSGGGGGGSGGGGSGSVTTTPSVETNAATEIKDSSAVLNGSIISNKGYDITDYGFVWSTDSSNLTNKLAVGTDDHSGAFTAALDDLTAGTTYYFKAYAINKNGTSYGVVRSFSTTGSSQTTPPPTTPTTRVFSDVSSSHWAYGVINQLSSAGYVYGYPDGSFKPDNTITRAEFVSVINKALKLQAYNPATPDFNDVSPTDWFYASVENSVNADIIKGYGNRIFGPGNQITREELATILVNALAKQDEASLGGNTDFTDDAGISSWASGSIVVAVKYGLLKGYPDGSFKPQGNATRAEACAMIVGFLNAQSEANSSSQ